MLTQIVHKLDNHIDPIILSYGGGVWGSGDRAHIYIHIHTHVQYIIEHNIELIEVAV